MFATRMKRPCHPPVKYDNCAKLQKKSQNSFALKKILFILKFLNLIFHYRIIHSETDLFFALAFAAKLKNVSAKFLISLYCSSLRAHFAMLDLSYSVKKKCNGEEGRP